MQSMEVQFLWNYKTSLLGSRNKLNTYVVSAGFCGFEKPQILSVLNEVNVCYKTQTQFSALRFLINKEKKEHLNIDEDIKITVCTCWQ